MITKGECGAPDLVRHHRVLHPCGDNASRTDTIIMFAIDLFTVFVGIFFGLFLIKMFKGKSHKNFPPGPKPLPIIGNLHILNLKRPYKTFLELSKTFGPVFSVQIGSKRMVILCGYETVKDALVNYAEEFSERPDIPIFQDLTRGYGVIFSHGENWKMMRRFTISTLKDLGMGKNTIQNKISEECDFLAQKFKSYGGKPFENTLIINAAVANIIASIILGHRLDYDDPKFLRLLSLINENVRLAETPMVLLYNTFRSLIRWFPGSHRQMNENSEELEKSFTETFTKHKEQLDVNDQRTLIDAFFVKQQEEKSEFGPFFHNENLIVIITNLFVAGVETTSTTLRWSLLLMMKYPDIQKNVQNEIEKVLGSSEPQSEHRKLMPYTDAVIHEVQRFANIIPTNVPHATAQDVTFKGYFIPKGTYVMPLLTSVLRDEAYFEKPNEFFPGHFLDSKGNFVKNEAFLPFSAGKRSCAGENLAKMELFLFFTRLLQKFTFEAPSGAELDLTPALGFTTPPMTYLIQAIPRAVQPAVCLPRTVSCLLAETNTVIMFAIDLFTILVGILCCLFFIKIFKESKDKNCKNFPPGPKPLPIIGNMHILNLKRPYKTFLELSKKFGPVFSVQIGSEKVVVLCGYETVKDALVNHAEEFSERPYVPIFQDISKGYGVTFSHGENWKVMRRFTISTLRDLGMGRKTIENQINEECDFLVKKFKSYGGKPFENTMIMNAAVANIIVSILLGHRFDYEDPVFLQLMSYINENIRLAGTPMVMLYNTFTSLIRWLPGCHRKVNQNAVDTQKFIRETFKKKKEQLDVNDQRTLIDTFLVKQQEEKAEFASYFHNENLVILVGNLFAAGMETTSTTLRWGLLLMMKYPEIQKNVQIEIEKVLGSSEPQSEHRKLMPYTDAVIHEVQRFSNIIPTNLPHATAQDVTFKGFFIPKGTYVMPLLTSVLRDEAYFEKPNEFYPQHFLDSKGNFVKNEAFLPFSAGKRSCAGEKLAKMELFLFFTRLLQNFTFHAPPGEELDLTPAVGFTTPPMTYLIQAISRS
ncbi:uncharacterized protein ACNLHF_014153 [Anomaloglossus baeobatrachus]